MKPTGAARHFILAFVLALIGYAVFYQAIEYRRTRHGPWQVAFTNSAAGDPLIVIDQPELYITNVRIVFPGQQLPASNAPAASEPKPESPDSRSPHRAPRTTNPPPASSTLIFSQPRPVPYDVPFGKCLFMDTTFLPGTVTLRLVGHEIELLPRVLIIDHEEHPWKAGEIITLRPAPEVEVGSRR
jgi:hypothetical protein